MSSLENPGTQMAKAVEAEITKFRDMQEEIGTLRHDLQTVLSQQSENEMVKHELDILEDSSTVYKMIGPVLMKNDLDDAKETVKNRLEFIGQERERLEKCLKDKETRATQAATKIQEMQAGMQKAAVEAAKAAAAAAAATAGSS